MPRGILNPRAMWKDKLDYDKSAKELPRLFVNNFNKFKNVQKEILDAGPRIGMIQERTNGQKNGVSWCD